MTPAELLGHLEGALTALTVVQRELEKMQPDCLHISAGLTMRQVQLEVARQVLAAHGGNRLQAARSLGLSRRTINYWFPLKRPRGTPQGGDPSQ